MLLKLRKFIENNKIYIPIVAGAGALLLAVLIGFFIAQGRLTTVKAEHEKSLQAYNAAEERLLKRLSSAVLMRTNLSALPKRTSVTAYLSTANRWGKMKALSIPAGLRLPCSCRKIMGRSL